MKTRIWVFATGIVCAIVVLLGVVSGLLPQLSAANSTHQLADNTEDQNLIFQAQLDALSNDDANLTELNRELETLRQAIPGEAESAVFVAQLAAIEVSTGARLSAYHVLTPFDQDVVTDPTAEQVAEGEAATDGAVPVTPTASGLLPIPLTLEATGETREQVVDFVRALQVGDRLITVELVRISTGSSSVWLAEIQGAIYVYPGSVPAATATE